MFKLDSEFAFSFICNAIGILMFPAVLAIAYMIELIASSDSTFVQVLYIGAMLVSLTVVLALFAFLETSYFLTNVFEDFLFMIAIAAGPTGGLFALCVFAGLDMIPLTVSILIMALPYFVFRMIRE